MKRERLDKFSIRKLTVGAASVLIGVAFGATTVSATEQPVQPAGHTVNPSDPKKDTPAAPSHSEGETGIGYLNLDTLPDGFTGPVKDSSFTGALYIPIVGKDVN